MPDTLRSCIISEENYTFLSLDASQIELRVLAILSQDPKLLEDLATGDLHMATAIRMFGDYEDGEPASEETIKKRRYDAKQANFALVYGADAYKLAEMLECEVAEAEEFMAEHRETYPVLYEWMDTTKAQAREDGYVVNMFGRIRPLPELYGGSFKVREKAEREIVNTIVQGSAVDIVKIAMLHLRRILDPRVRLVLQVHDEILWECPDELLQSSLSQCGDLDSILPQYPFDIQTGKVYGEMEAINA